MFTAVENFSEEARRNKNPIQDINFLSELLQWIKISYITIEGLVEHSEYLRLNRIFPKVEISRVEYITVTCRHIWCHEKWLGRVNLCHRKFAVFTVIIYRKSCFVFFLSTYGMFFFS